MKSAETAPTHKQSIWVRAFQAPIKAYQRMISPFLSPACRFHPTCSQYALDSLGRHGVLRGIWYSLRRLVRCHPFNEGGYDPTP